MILFVEVSLLHLSLSLLSPFSHLATLFRLGSFQTCDQQMDRQLDAGSGRNEREKMI